MFYEWAPWLNLWTVQRTIAGELYNRLYRIRCSRSGVVDIANRFVHELTEGRFCTTTVNIKVCVFRAVHVMFLLLRGRVSVTCRLHRFLWWFDDRITSVTVVVASCDRGTSHPVALIFSFISIEHWCIFVTRAPWNEDVTEPKKHTPAPCVLPFHICLLYVKL